MNNVIETFLRNGGAGIQPLVTNGAPVTVIGEGVKTVELEQYLSAPLRVKENRKFDDLRGFVAYVNDFKTDSTAIFAGRTRLEAVFDYHKSGAAAWGDHRISFDYTRSARWKLWESKNNVWMKQRDFADFIDSGLNEVVEAEQGGILAVVKDFRATVKAEAEAEVGKGGTNFIYREEIKGGSAKKTDILVPEYIGVEVAPFEGIGALNSLIADTKAQVPVFAFRGKICWRLDDDRKPEFKVQLLHFENAVESTLEALRVAMEGLTGCKVYIGG